MLYPDEDASLLLHSAESRGRNSTACKSLKTVQAKQCSPQKNQLQQKEKHHTSYEVQCFFGGEYRDRTGDLLHAMQALSQLS